MSKKNFWITNITKKDVTLGDLNVTIRSFKSIDLLSKGFYLTESQINNSLDKGSLSKRVKQNIISVCKVTPSPIPTREKIEASKEPIFSRGKFVTEIKEEFYEELQINDEEFAKEQAEFEELERQPILSRNK